MEELRNTLEQCPCPSKMNFICFTFLIISGITGSRSEQYEVVGPAGAVFAVVGEDVILPCSVKPNISVVDMRVEWFRPDLKDSQLVHLYKDHEDRNTDQSQSYEGRTKLNHQELQRGNASLKVSSVQVSDEGPYRCFIQSTSWYDDATVDVIVEAVGSPPVITVDRFDHSGGLHLQCESEGWDSEPVLEWLNSEGVSLSSETTEVQRNTDGFSVKHTITVHHRADKIHCRVKLRHHMLETMIVTSSKSFNPWRTSVILSSIVVALIVIAGVLIAAFGHKYREHDKLQNENRRKKQEHDTLQTEISRKQEEHDQLQEEKDRIQQQYSELLQNGNKKIAQERNQVQEEKQRIQQERDRLQNANKKIKQDYHETYTWTNNQLPVLERVGFGIVKFAQGTLQVRTKQQGKKTKNVYETGAGGNHRSRVFERDKNVAGREITVVDTPGMFDTDLSEKELLKQKIGKCINMTSPGPHAIVLVIKLGTFTEEERLSVKRIRAVFGEEADKHTIVLFTHGDERPAPLKRFTEANEALKEILRRCGGGCHVFNNKNMEDRKQVVELLQKVDAVVAANGGEHYTSDLYQDVELMLKTEPEELKKQYERSSENWRPNLLKRRNILGMLSSHKIKELFGQEVFKYSIILFTHGDLLEEDPIEKFIKQYYDVKM
ncbi:hypothetical protein QQF64_025712 [Cirrhinus molitorella]|uniref:Uncharacterized protein n=1 Tax=Cirrhinus molitorella TaxID=172907 RepID=A0ABR3NQ46_9TELE